MAAKREKRTMKNAYKMPDKITKGEILTDVKKVSWTIGNSIGVGGFGEIYVAAKTAEPSRLAYAVKIEPLENGPLFCERMVYINIGKKEDIEDFRKLRSLKSIGIPCFHGFGRHTFKNVEYRFIVIDKLGKDIHSFFKAEKRLPYATVLKIGIQILHVLEYMHSKAYVHCDVKGGNLLLGEEKGTENQVYVVDFGLACQYVNTYKPNPKKAHNGTPEYTSRDAHAGVMTRRGDVEILAYNLLHWTSGQLPWEKLTDSQEIQAKKENLMKTPDALLAVCYKTEPPPSAVKKFLCEICKMEPMDEPDYAKLEKTLATDLKKLKSNPDKLEFISKVEDKTPGKKIRQTTVASNGCDTASPRKRKRPKRVLSDTDTDENEKVPVLRVKKTETVKKSWRDCPTVLNGATRSQDVNTPKKRKNKLCV